MRSEKTATANRAVGLHAPTVSAFVGSLALAALFGWQTVLHFTTGIVGGRSDGYENLWNDWWFRTALFDLHRSPFFSDWIEYPLGTSLRFHTLNPLGGLIALPLAPLLGGIGALNFKLLLALALATFFTYLLLRDLTGSHLPAFVGAAVYTYANDQMVLGALKATENYLMGAALLPLFCFFLLRAATRDRWVGHAAAATATLLALALTDWQYTLFAIIFAALYFLVTAIQRRDPRAIAAVLARCAAIGIAWAVVTLPTLMLPMLAEARRSPWIAIGEWQASGHSKALFDFLEPGYQNPGYYVLAATVIGLILFWRRSAPGGDRAAVVLWACIAAFGVLLSLGPYLQTRLDQATPIPLPYAAANAVPLLAISRKPFLYYTSFGMLGIGALLAFALRSLLPALVAVVGRLARRAPGPRAARVVSGVFAALLLVGTLIPSLLYTREGDFAPPEWPAFYQNVLAKDPERYAILESPLFVRQRGRSDALYQAFQIVHGKYRFGSSVARDHKADNPDLFVKRATLFRDFFNGNPSVMEIYRPTTTPDFLTPPAYETVGVPLLNYYHVRYIVLYLDALAEGAPPGVDVTRRVVRQTLGADVAPVYADEEMEVYRVPDAPPRALPLFIDTGSVGWWKAEKGADGLPFRWVDTRDDQGAELVVFNLSNEKRRARVQFTAFNYRAARDVTVAINGFPADRLSLAPGGSQDVTLELDMPPGMNVLTLASPQPPIPVDTRDGKDNRLLSFGVRQVRMAQIG